MYNWKMQDFVSMEQVHGNNVVFVSSKDLGQKILDCDGLITNDPKVKLCVKAADCLPIFFYDPISNSMGVVHAGWRGLENKIIRKIVDLMNSKKLLVYIGPHICQKHYEVKSDVSVKFLKYKGSIKKAENKEYLDLAKVAKIQLIEAGVSPENIKIDSTCTFEDKNLFSYRRDRKRRANSFLLTLDFISNNT